MLCKSVLLCHWNRKLLRNRETDTHISGKMIHRRQTTTILTILNDASIVMNSTDNVQQHNNSSSNLMSEHNKVFTKNKKYWIGS